MGSYHLFCGGTLEIFARLDMTLAVYQWIGLPSRQKKDNNSLFRLLLESTKLQTSLKWTMVAHSIVTFSFPCCSNTESNVQLPRQSKQSQRQPKWECWQNRHPRRPPRIHPERQLQLPTEIHPPHPYILSSLWNLCRCVDFGGQDFFETKKGFSQRVSQFDTADMDVAMTHV